MPVIPLKCPSCGAALSVDGAKRTAVCQYCGQTCIVPDAAVCDDTAPICFEADFDITGGLLEQYNGGSPDVIIPDGVIVIGSYAFHGMPIRSVALPDSLKVIGEGAFMGCARLERIVIPDGVTEIGECAFMGCDALTDAVIPGSVTTIGKMAFMNCTAMTDAVIPDSVIMIGALAFMCCKSLKNVTLSGNTCVGECAFASTAWEDAREDETARALFFRDAGRCRSCGGKFKGLFRKKCSRCGRPKDY